jgi:hypothetical protein
MRSKFLLASTASAILLLTAGTAQAISYGVNDEQEHPMVGVLLDCTDDGRGGEGCYVSCTGTLLQGKNGGLADGKDVFLTATHCVTDYEPRGTLKVAFDEMYNASTSTLYTGLEYYDERYFTEPGYGYETAVIVLDESPGLPYASLTAEGYLDDLKYYHELKDQAFTAVGYGQTRTSKKNAWQALHGSGRRLKADQEAQSLQASWFILKINQGNGGTCWADSGNPHFVGGTFQIVSLGVYGDPNCKNQDKTYRVDTAEAREFLAEFVDLPLE